MAAVSDCGLELDAFSSATRPLPAVRAQLPLADSTDELRRLERLLRPTRTDAAHATWSNPSPMLPITESACTHDDVADVPPAINGSYRRSPKSSAGLSLLLFSGATSLLTGLFLLIAANLLIHPAAWRWGFAAATGGQGVLLAAVALVAIRLWRNSRRLKQQLELVDRRLNEVQSALAPPSAELSTSMLRNALRRPDRTAEFSLTVR